MLDKQIEKIINANHDRFRYFIHISKNSHIEYKGILDFSKDQQYITISEFMDIKNTAEAFYYLGKGIGHKIGSEAWFLINDLPIPDYLSTSLSFFENSSPTYIRERNQAILYDFEFEWPPSVSEKFDESLFRYFRSHHNPSFDAFIKRFKELTQKSSFSVTVSVSAEDYRIIELNFDGLIDGKSTEFVFRFGSYDSEIPRYPNTATDNIITEIPFAALLMKFIYGLGGWTTRANHGLWAQKSIESIKENDDKDPMQKRYAEIYEWADTIYLASLVSAGGTTYPVKVTDPDKDKHHPIVIGSVYEDNAEMPKFYEELLKHDPNIWKSKDYFYPSTEYKRDVHHYGGEDIGVKYRWYFEFYDVPDTTKSGDRYYSARDWGYGESRLSKVACNRLSFSEAINQYNCYTFEGKRAAYLMIGHVVHLLQDMGQPDHARLIDHAASSMDEREAFDKFKVCEIVTGIVGVSMIAPCGAATIFAPICVAAFVSIALVTCEALIDSDEVGYEKLIDKKLKEGGWSLHEIEAEIKAEGVKNRSNYDEYFLKLASFSKSVADNMNLSSPLGLSAISIPFVHSSIPSLNPDIDQDDPAECKPFIDLTKKIIPRIISESAGLIQYFFKIVNHPPIAEKVAVIQYESNKKPVGFATFPPGAPYCVRYGAKWKVSGNHRSLEYNHVQQNLSPDQYAYIFIMFGPSLVGPGKVSGTFRSMGRVMKDVELRLTGNDPITGQSIDQKVTLKIAEDPKTGYYYWGVFKPRNCGRDIYTLNLVINGRDLGGHFKGRSDPGDQLDGNPKTLAQAATKFPYEWTNYSPHYPDIYHKVSIEPAQWKTIINPNKVILDRKRNQATARLAVKQKTWSCSWEPYWGVATCPVSWRLVERIKRIDSTITAGSFDEFHIHFRLSQLNSNSTEILIDPDWKHVQSGHYQISIIVEVGKPGNLWTDIIQLDLIIISI